MGGVAPHAGWYFSGKAAAWAIAAVAQGPKPDRVIVFGGHLPAGHIPIAYGDEGWETPFGVHPIDTELTDELISRGTATAAPSHFTDNTIEVQLPFVGYFFPDTPIVAVHSPASEAALSLSAAIDELLDSRGLSATYIGSADLTHYGPNYGFSPKGTGAEAVDWVKSDNDRSLIEKALAMDAQGLLADARDKHNSCSPGPIASVIGSAKRRGVRQGRLLDYYTSYDIAPGSSFVGYAAIVY